MVVIMCIPGIKRSRLQLESGSKREGEATLVGGGVGNQAAVDDAKVTHKLSLEFTHTHLLATKHKRTHIHTHTLTQTQTQTHT